MSIKVVTLVSGNLLSLLAEQKETMSGRIMTNNMATLVALTRDRIITEGALKV